MTEKRRERRRATVQPSRYIPDSARYLPDGTRVTDPQEYYQRLLDRLEVPENHYLELSDRHARRIQRRQARKQAKQAARAAANPTQAKNHPPNTENRYIPDSARYLPDGTRVTDPQEYYQRLLDRLEVPENHYLELSDRHARRIQRRQARKQAKQAARAAAKAETPTTAVAGRDDPRPA